ATGDALRVRLPGLSRLGLALRARPALRLHGRPSHQNLAALAGPCRDSVGAHPDWLACHGILGRGAGRRSLDGTGYRGGDRSALAPLTRVWLGGLAVREMAYRSGAAPVGSHLRAYGVELGRVGAWPAADHSISTPGAEPAHYHGSLARRLLGLH